MSPTRRQTLCRHERGFTLIELMVVLVIVALSAGLVSLTMPDPRQGKLEREAARLSMLLDSARAQSRVNGSPVAWWPQPDPSASQDQGSHGFHFTGLPKELGLPQQWLNPETRVEIIGARAITLGPEPILPAQRLVLSIEGLSLSLASDGLGPFQVVRTGELPAGEKP